MFMWKVSRSSLQFGLPTCLANATPSSGGVQHVVLEAVDDLHAKQHPAILGGFHRLTHTFHRPIREHALGLSRQKLRRPSTVVDPGHDGAVQLLHGARQVLQKGDAFFARGRVLGPHVQVGGHADCRSV
jgi:hypothetical protein